MATHKLSGSSALFPKLLNENASRKFSGIVAPEEGRHSTISELDIDEEPIHCIKRSEFNTNDEIASIDARESVICHFPLGDDVHAGSGACLL